MPEEWQLYITEFNWVYTQMHWSGALLILSNIANHNTMLYNKEALRMQHFKRRLKFEDFLCWPMFTCLTEGSDTTILTDMPEGFKKSKKGVLKYMHITYALLPCLYEEYDKV